MAAIFPAGGANLTSLVQIPLATGFPATVGIWVKTTAATFWPVVFISNAAGDNFYLASGNTAAQQWGIQAASNSGANASNVFIGTVVPNAWTFLLGRWISITNRRIAVLNPGGTISAAQDTNTITVPPAALTNNQLGGNFGAGDFSGTIGEVWSTNTDVWPGGGAIDASFLIQLARMGPFSIPSVAENVQYYQPFRRYDASLSDQTENYNQNGARLQWINTGVFIGGDDPPLAPGYPRPSDTRRIADI